MSNESWGKICRELHRDISDRRGLKWEWRKIDIDVRREIFRRWRQIIEAQLAEHAEALPVRGVE